MKTLDCVQTKAIYKANCICLFVCFRENFIHVDIFFSQLKKQKVKQIKAYEITQFLGKLIKKHKFIIHRKLFCAGCELLNK